MGIRFRKRVKLLPGIHINISKSGTSVTAGVKGASVNIGKRGAYINTGIPGSGIYSRERITANKQSKNTKQKNSNVDSEIINKNPLRFIIIFLSLFSGCILPLITGTGWWLLLIPFGLIIGFCITDNNVNQVEKKANNQDFNINQTNIEPTIDIDNTASTKLLISNDRLKEETDVESCKSVEYIDMNRLDPLFEDAARLIVVHQQGSTSMIQRKFSIGYSRAGRIMDQLEYVGIVSESTGSKPRYVLCKDENELEYTLKNLDESKLDNLCKKEEEENKATSLQIAFEENSRLINLGINLEKERMINEAISVYEKSITSRLAIAHPYNRLMILYRKKKDYENEIRVIKIAIDVFMRENERRAGRIIEEDSSLYNQVMQALETIESFRYEDNKWAFVQYDVMDYIIRLGKTKKLLQKHNNLN